MTNPTPTEYLLSSSVEPSGGETLRVFHAPTDQLLVIPREVLRATGRPNPIENIHRLLGLMAGELVGGDTPDPQETISPSSLEEVKASLARFIRDKADTLTIDDEAPLALKSTVRTIREELADEIRRQLGIEEPLVSDDKLHTGQYL